MEDHTVAMAREKRERENHTLPLHCTCPPFLSPQSQLTTGTLLLSIS